MDYILVLQWPASSIEDYDRMVAVEDLLMERLHEGEVDGHDAGEGEVNIFIRTDDPRSTFAAVESVLAKRDSWADIRVAYREATGSAYTVLWPAGLSTFSVS